MAGINRRYDGEYENRGRSGEVFRLIDVGDILGGNATRGFGFHNDFLSVGDLADWTFVDNTPSGAAATFAEASGKGGIARISSVSTTAAEGGQIQYGDGNMFLPAAGSTIAGEISLNVTGIANLNVEFFFGLCAEDGTVLATGINNADNYAGFFSTTDDGVLVSDQQKAASQELGTTALHTLVSGEQVRLGFRFNGVSSVEYYVNRALVETVTADIPAVAMTPTLAISSGGTDAPIADIDWICVIQQDQGD